MREHSDNTVQGVWKIVVFVLAVIFLSSCSYIPFFGKKSESKDEKKTEQVIDKKTGQPMERIDDKEAKPGDIKVIDGVEYIYARNKKFMLTPYEPELVWVRKDQYSPGIFESLTGGPSTSKKEREELEKRIARLEEELKKKGLSPHMVYPTQLMGMPGYGGYMTMVPLTFSYPSPKMKRRVIVLPMTDQTNYKSEHMGDLATKRLISKMEATGAIVCVDPATIKLNGNITDAKNLKILNEIYGIQAVIKGVISDVYTSTTRLEGKDEKETSFAISRISADVYNTETGIIMKKLSGRNPISLSREKGDLSSEKAKIRSIDFAIEVIGEDLLKSILTLDWHTRIASIEEGKIYVNAGRLSNLAKGDVLEVFSPGQDRIDEKTKAPLGKTKGTFKGEIEVVELFGVDASWAKVRKGTNFSATDIVYLKKVDQK